ncbi:MAG: glycosyltransferase [Acidimicrobiaceae bacterium]|nr:glycosyltransferase [Acidimicrobiaceae bacterium]
MKASVIIPVRNQSFLTRLCLAALELVDLGDAEVIVVDNGSTDDTPDLLTQWARSPERRVLRSHYNRNFGPGCNWGATEAHGDVLVFLNNDTFVLQDWLPALIRSFADQSVTAAGSLLLYPNGRVQHAGVAFDQHGPFHVFSGLPPDCPVVQDPRDCQAVTGASLAVRRDDFEAVGGFDGSYQNSGEDIDLCLRLRERGGRIRYIPDSVAYHFESMTEGRLDANQRGLDLLKERWASRWVHDLPQLAETAAAAGCDLSDRRLPAPEVMDRFRSPETREQRLSRLEAMEREVNELWIQFREREQELSQLHLLQEQVAQLRRRIELVRPLEQEVAELRAKLNRRSVRLGLAAGRLGRKVIPPRHPPTPD